MNKKEKRCLEIIKMTKGKPRKWSEMRKSLGIAEATLGRYLEELRGQNILSKDFDENDKVIYVLNEDELKDSEWETKLEEKESSQKKIEELLHEKGLFSTGMELEEFKDFVNNNEELLKQLPLEYSFEDMTDFELNRIFTDLMSILVTEETEINAEYKVER